MPQPNCLFGRTLVYLTSWESVLGAGWLLALIVVVSPLRASANDRVPVGAAKIDITPDHPIRLTGYGNRRAESAGVAQRLWAKAIAFGGDEGDGPAVWIGLENCGLTPAIRDHVAQALQEQAGVQSSRLAISVTHTHTGPALTNWAPYLFGADIPPEHQQRIDQYTQLLTGKLVQVARDALAQRRPAQLAWGRGRVGFAVNRRVLQDGKWTGFGEQSDGPVDHRLSVLAARDDHGKLLACIANYACHCTTLGGAFNQIAGDWAGFAQEAMEANHPGCIAMVTIGCGADANPSPRSDDLAVCKQQGTDLATEVDRLVQQGLQPLPAAPPQCKLTYLNLPYAPPRSEQEWETLAQGSGVTAYHAQQYLARLRRGEKLPTELRYPIGTWTFGDALAVVLLGGEVVVDYSIRMDEAFDAERLWITAYTNDVPCYIPSRRILREGGYEADRSMALYARPNVLAPEVEDMIHDAVQKLLPHAFYSAARRAEFPGPRSPEESLAAIRVLDGWQVELVAAEPLIEDPVAFDWGPDGRLWVVEMRDYPNGLDWHQPEDRRGRPGGRVKVLTDDDGDGRYDRASLFLDEIPFPTGVKVWREGVLITAAPAILYAEDTDGDGQADRREEWFTGFVEGNQQHRVNGLRWGLDNWLYVANGDSGGKVRSKSGVEVAIGGRDLRLRPDSGELEAQSGQTQFGRCRDDWNHWFGGNNANPLWHYVLEDHYLRRNPHFVPPAVRRDVPEVPGTAPVYPASRTLARFNDFHTANRFTSACSPDIYRDDWLHPQLGRDGMHVFICEPVHNLVHHSVMTEAGVSFRSRRPDSERDREFFASADNWSRPVMVRTGPDGAIWIADMYRQVIEHPEWIPQTWQRKLDLRAGSDRGRIYRVFPREVGVRPLPRFQAADPAGWVRQLEHSNGWVRDTAQQLLLWHPDAGVVPALTEMARSSPNPLARGHALCTLEGLQSVSRALIVHALQDAHPGVRRQAVRIAESMADRDPELGTEIAQLADDPDAKVQMQVAYSLGEWSSAQAAEGLARLALRRANESAIVAAVLSSIHPQNLEKVASAVLEAPEPPATVVQPLLAVAGRLGEQTVLERLVLGLLQRHASDPFLEQARAATGVLTALESLPASPAKVWAAPVLGSLERIQTKSRDIAGNRSRPLPERLAAIGFLGSRGLQRLGLPSSSDAELLSGLLALQEPPEIQAAALEGLAHRYPQEFAPRALAGWRSHSPALRARIVDALFLRPTTIKPFLDAVQRGEVVASEIDSRRRQQLFTHSDLAIRERARELFSAESVSPRGQVLEQYRPALELAAESSRGKEVFGKRCAVCHRLEGKGHPVGPDLLALTDKTPSSLLVAILDPNRAVEDKFLDYHAITVDGRQLTGMVAGETSTSITLVGQEGKQLDLRRNEIESIQSSGKSLMPEGMEKDLTPQELADVIAYIRTLSAPPKTFPGNQPELAHVRDDGSIRLLAMHAKIYGPKLIFEEKYRNLGYWQSPEDHAVWMLEVPKGGRYQLRIDYACDDQAAGDRFQIRVGDQVLGGVVEGTGSWDRYRSLSVGTVELPQGSTELTMRSDGAIRSALIDLRQIILEPR